MLNPDSSSSQKENGMNGERVVRSEMNKVWCLDIWIDHRENCDVLLRFPSHGLEDGFVIKIRGEPGF